MSAGLAVMLFLGGCGGASRVSQEETTDYTSTTFIRLKLSPINAAGVVGSATFAQAAAGTKVHLILQGLPKPNGTYLAHVHPGSCEGHPHASKATTAAHYDHEHADVHAREDDSATADEIGYPLMPVKSNTEGAGSSSTVLEGLTVGELLTGDSKYINVHAAGSGDPPQLVCANLSEAS